MPTIVERALRLWTEPVPAVDAGVAAFRTVYADPLVVNGLETPLVELVERARMLQRAIEPLHQEVFEEFDALDRAAFAFRLYGRHVGPLATPLGDLAATGQELEMRGMDIFEVDKDCIVAVWAVADWLTSLSAVGGVTLAGNRAPN
jgi:hypothetical protein